MKLIHIKEPIHSKENTAKQAKAILKFKPDIILFEFPSSNNNLSYFNKFKPDKKPKQIIKQLKKLYTIISKRYPWFKSQHMILESIEHLWQTGKQVYLYEIDGPVKLTSAGVGTHGRSNMVWNYLREEHMIKNILKIDSDLRKNKTALIFCHDYHWKNINFLLKKPNKQKVWKHYFGNDTKGNIEKELKRENKILYKYWKRINKI